MEIISGYGSTPPKIHVLKPKMKVGKMTLPFKQVILKPDSHEAREWPKGRNFSRISRATNVPFTEDTTCQLPVTAFYAVKLTHLMIWNINSKRCLYVDEKAASMYLFVVLYGVPCRTSEFFEVETMRRITTYSLSLITITADLMITFIQRSLSWVKVMPWLSIGSSKSILWQGWASKLCCKWCK